MPYNAIQGEDNPCFSVQIAHKTSKTFSNLGMAFQSSKRVFSAASLCKNTDTDTHKHAHTPQHLAVGHRCAHLAASSHFCMSADLHACVCECPKRRVSPSAERDHSTLGSTSISAPERKKKKGEIVSLRVIVVLGKERMST